MNYSIYNHIAGEEFDQLQKRIENLRKYFDPALKRQSFHLNTRDYDEVLGLDYIRHHGTFFGNIGFLYKDVEGLPTFNFYVAKRFDTNKRRFFKRENVADNISIDFIEKNYENLLASAFSKFKEMKE